LYEQPWSKEEPIVKWKATLAALCLAAVSTIPATADNVSLVPSQDNTLYEVAVEKPEGQGQVLSNGAGEFFFAGLTARGGDIRRGLLAFDVAGPVPAGSIITEVTLTLEMSKTIVGASTVELRRVTSDWGEGTSDAGDPGGGGAPATTDDATWLHTFFPSAFWVTEGGDFSATVTAAQSVGGNGPYTWGSTPEMVADVQSWLDNPATNFGWLVMGDEAVSPSAKRFNTRENTVGVPQLAITYQAPVPTVPGSALLLLAVILAALAVRRNLRAPKEVSH
jgi:hypothetical protein